MPRLRSTAVAHMGGVCDVVYDADGTHLLTCGADSFAKVHRCEGEGVGVAEDGSKQHVTVRELEEGDDGDNTLAGDDDAPGGVHCVAMSPRGTHFITGGEDRTLRVYSHPEGTFEANVTRFELPIRACAYDPSGNTIAAAGDDDSIKLIDTSDYKVFRVFKAADGFPVASLAYDPKGELLASVGTDGTLHIWDVQSGGLRHTERRIAPVIEEDELGTPLGGRNRCAWRGAEGSFLAVPGRDNKGVVVLRREDFRQAFELKGHHVADVSVISFSANGMYCATAALDGSVMLWDVAKKEDLDRLRLDNAIACGLAWKPEGNALTVIDTSGKYGVWENPIPDHMPPPTAPLTDADRAREKDVADLYRFDDDSMDQGDGDGVEGTDVAGDADAGRVAPRAARGYDAVGPQPAFQVGETPPDESGVRFLALSLDGRIIARAGDDAGEQVIEVELHDTTRGARVPAFVDYDVFTMASLSVKGMVLARGRNAAGDASVIAYRPFTSWGGNAEWKLSLPSGEDAVAVSAGTTFVAVATSVGNLRLFSPAGVQRAVLSIPGPTVCMAARGRDVAVAWHAAAPGALGEQRLRVTTFDALEASQLAETSLPLTAGSTLTWLGFAEGGAMAAADSAGLVRCQLAGGAGAWSPIFSASHAQQTGSERYWTVGLSDAELCCVVLNNVDVPSVTPRPVMSFLDLVPPSVPSDMAGTGEYETALLSAAARLGVRRAAAAAADDDAKDRDDDDVDDDMDGVSRAEEEVLKAEKEMDGYLLRLLQACCKADKLQRALELAAMLNRDASLEGAIKLSNALRKPALSERMSLLLEAREAQAAQAAAAAAAYTAPTHAAPVAAVAPSTYLDADGEQRREERATSAFGKTSAARKTAAPAPLAQDGPAAAGADEGEETEDGDESNDDEEDEDEDELVATKKALAAAAMNKPRAANPFARKVTADPPSKGPSSLAAAVKDMQGSAEKKKRKLSSTIIGGRKGSKKTKA
eukprot:PRCOL_00001230-RA